MIIHLLTVGRIRHAAVREAGEDYLSRARRYFRIELKEIPDAVRRGRPPAQALRTEGEALLRALPPRALAVALTRAGRAEDSLRFARRVAGWQQSGRDVALLIGGASGLGAAVLDHCATRLSLSSFTLPHELARVVLLEQLYRAGTILRGEPYHKGAA